MPLLTTIASGGVKGLGWSAASASEELGGMVLLTPTSIAYTGTSASIGTNGSVEFTACSVLSLNGVFSADYDNYMVGMRITSTSSDTNLNLRLRVGGVDNATGSSYTLQSLGVNGTSLAGTGRNSNTFASPFGFVSTTARDGLSAFFYGPFLAQPTAMRQISAFAYANALIYDTAITHNQSTSYDGFTLIGQTSAVTGLVSVYGLVGA
jgi:hypothetical protein